MRQFEFVRDKFRKHENAHDIILPKRQSTGSAGYDFYNPKTFVIAPGETVKVSTDIKARMFDYEVLMIYIRSSIGIKHNLMLNNCCGIIDKDFYSNSENDGNITIALYNYGDKAITIEKGERIAQGIFQTYLTVNDESDKALLKKRVGGIGSTGK